MPGLMAALLLLAEMPRVYHPDTGRTCRWRRVGFHAFEPWREEVACSIQIPRNSHTSRGLGHCGLSYPASRDVDSAHASAAAVAAVVDAAVMEMEMAVVVVVVMAEVVVANMTALRDITDSETYIASLAPASLRPEFPRVSA